MKMQENEYKLWNNNRQLAALKKSGNPTNQNDVQKIEANEINKDYIYRPLFSTQVNSKRPVVLVSLLTEGG